MDGLLTELISSNVGCFMGRVYAGVFMFADDLKLLAPSVYALDIMLNICKNYASRFDVMFNDKSQLIIFKSKLDDGPDPEIFIHGKKLDAVNSITHLGNVIHDNIFKKDASKCVKDFYIQFNSFMGDFKYLGSRMRNYLFSKYCTSFYGSQILPIYDKSTMYDLCLAWRLSIKKVWRIPRTAHSNMLPILAGSLPPNLMFGKRAMGYINKCLKSDNKTVQTITGMAIYGTNSVLGKNYKYLSYKYNLNSNELYTSWNNYCDKNKDLIQTCEQIEKLCDVRDNFKSKALSRNVSKALIEALST